MPKIVRSRKPGHSRISSKKLGGKYSIKAKRPMKPVKLSMPGKVAQAKLDYDIAVEETLQSSITRDIQAIEQQMVNERNRYQVTTRKYVRGESQLIGDSQNYSMLKRQKETLQREQQRSNDRLATMKTNKIVSANPVKTATKSFRGISKDNPMQSGKSYVPVIPGSSIASPGPLGNLDNSFLNVLGAAKNLVSSLPSGNLIPQAYAASSTPFNILLKSGKQAGKQFTQDRKRGKEWMEGTTGQVVLAEREKAAKVAMKKATHQQIKKKQQELQRLSDEIAIGDVTFSTKVSMKEAKEAIGSDAAQKAQAKVLKLLGKEAEDTNKKKYPASKTAFFDPEDIRMDTEAGIDVGSNAAYSAAVEKSIAEDLASRSLAGEGHVSRDFLSGQRINKPKQIGISGAQGFGGGGDFSPNVSAAAWFDPVMAKKMVAAGTVLGSGTFLPLHAAYGDHAPPKAKGFDPVDGVMEFGGDFYKGVQGLFGAKQKRVIKRKPKKKNKKGKKR